VTDGRRVLPVAVAVLGALVVAGAVEARQPPRLGEREAITQALPAFLRNQPVGCVWLDVSVSNNRRWGTATPVYLNASRPPCLRYAANGYWILKKAAARWKIVWSGSDLPNCSLGVPRDLARCQP
jgi:hypothetical protein